MRRDQLRVLSTYSNSSSTQKISIPLTHLIKFILDLHHGYPLRCTSDPELMVIKSSSIIPRSLKTWSQRHNPRLSSLLSKSAHGISTSYCTSTPTFIDIYISFIPAWVHSRRTRNFKTSNQSVNDKSRYRYLILHYRRLIGSDEVIRILHQEKCLLD